MARSGSSTFYHSSASSAASSSSAAYYSSSSSAAIGSEIRSLETDVRGLQKEMGGEFENKVKTGDDKTGISAWWERVILWSPTRIREIEAAVRELQVRQKGRDGEEIKSPVKGDGVVIDEKGRLSALRLSVKELDTKVEATKIEEKIAEKNKKANTPAAAMERDAPATRNTEPEAARSRETVARNMGVQSAPPDAVNLLPTNPAQRGLV